MSANPQPASNATVLTLETVPYMFQLFDVENNRLYFLAGVKERPTTWAVTKADQPHKGMTLFFCTIHKRTFHPTAGTCPDCIAMPLPELAI